SPKTERARTKLSANKNESHCSLPLPKNIAKHYRRRAGGPPLRFLQGWGAIPLSIKGCSFWIRFPVGPLMRSIHGQCRAAARQNSDRECPDRLSSLTGLTRSFHFPCTYVPV